MNGSIANITRRIVAAGYLLTIGILLGSAANLHRGYQDSWILQDVEIQLALVALLFILYVISARDSSHVALAAALFVLTLNLLPAFKYAYPYGLAIDQGVHFANLRSYVMTGAPEANNIYSNQPGLYLAMAASALFNNVSAADQLRFAPPLILSSVPLLLYALGRSLRCSDSALRLIAICSAIAVNPYFSSLHTTSLGGVLFVFLVTVVVSREPSARSERPAWSALAVVTIATLAVTHVITSLFAAVVLAVSALGVSLVMWLQREGPEDRGITLVTSSTLLLGFVIPFSWWLYKAEFVLSVTVRTISEALSLGALGVRPPIPQTFFTLSFPDQLIVFILYHSDFVIVATLASIGIWSFLLNTRLSRIRLFGKLYLATTLIAILAMLAALLVFRVGQIEYSRFILYFVALAPIFMAIALRHVRWWLRRQFGNTRGQLIFYSLLPLLMLGALVQAFPYQPLVPQSASLRDQYGVSEPIVYLHAVLSEYQVSLLQFVLAHRPTTGKIGADIVTYNTAIGLWGIEPTRTWGLERAIPTRPLVDGRWEYFLAHHPGPAGPLYEQAPMRSLLIMSPTLFSYDLSVPYTNGYSFVISR